MAVPGVPKRGHFLLALSMLQTACWAKEPPNCDSIEAQRLSEFVSWCEGVCEVSYEAGFAQGIDCATDPAPYVNRVEEWISTHGGNPISDDPTDPCGFPFTGTGLCGSYTSSHSDKLAGAFDYGYYDGWREAGCEGDPVGDDMPRLTWPILEGDTGPTYTPGYYPCPEVYLP